MAAVPGDPPYGTVRQSGSRQERMGTIARLQGVSHSYGNTVAVDDVTLEIPSGKMIGFVGPDGVGKSSVLALISGVSIDELLNSTGLTPFRDRPAGKLSGGMKQKLGLCCALIHDPELLILIIQPLQMLSGGVTPRESMPEFVQNLMLFAPTTHFVSFAQAILYRGAGLDIVWTSFVAIIGIGIAYFLVAHAMFRRSVTMTQS